MGSRVPVVASGKHAVPGQPQVDEHTVALYHFDAPDGNWAIDATGRYTGTLQGNALVTTAGLYAGVLQLDGTGSYVRLGNLGNLPEGTVEAFVDFSKFCTPESIHSSIITAGSDYGGNGDVLQLTAAVTFRIYANNRWNEATSGVNPCKYLWGGDNTNNFRLWQPPLEVKFPYETWRFHHLAATWGPRGMEIWLDGVLYGVGVYTDPPPLPYRYHCNPQYYVSSPFYPERCTTPVVAPPYPPGDYTGGLSPYTTFLIGCNSSAQCFNGSIDEVRISNIQRTFSWTVVPTVTPTPTPTQVAITAEYPVDSKSLALLHLNSLVPCQYSACVWDEVSSQPKPAYGNSVSNGRFNGAFGSKSDGLVIEPGKLPNLPEGTLEAWVIFQNSPKPQPIFSVARYANDQQGAISLGTMGPGGKIFMSIFDGTQHRQLVSEDTAEHGAGCWRHIAGTWGGRGLEIWIDGIRRSVNATYTGGANASIYNWRVGGDFAGNLMQGVLDEVRVSSVQRTFTTTPNRANFLPHTPSSADNRVFLPAVLRDYIQVPGCPFGP
jgi:hypothetical protein